MRKLLSVGAETDCEQRGIDLAVLPPRRPQLNGCVERANGTSRTEFWSLYLGAMTVQEANAEYQNYVRYYNEERPHRGINMMTPNEFHANIVDAARKSEMS